MGTEIERKFLVTGQAWAAQVTARRTIRQAYLAGGARAVIRVRTVDDAQAVITIKSGGLGLARAEFEYPIPVEDAQQLFALRVGEIVEKHRHIIPAGDLKWEVDVFFGAHAGLSLAEIELRSETDAFERPDWLGAEVTGDHRYYNSTLAGIGEAGPQ